MMKLTKECDNLRQKIKRRDRHIEDLEDDNVKLLQLKSALESQLAKKEYQMKKIERKLSSLQNDVRFCLLYSYSHKFKLILLNITE